MMYPFMTLDDNTEIVHSEMLPDQRVKVYFEKPDAKDCFHSAVCYLPDYTWTDISGFTPEEIGRYQKFLETTAHLDPHSCVCIAGSPQQQCHEDLDHTGRKMLSMPQQFRHSAACAAEHHGDH